MAFLKKLTPLFLIFVFHLIPYTLYGQTIAANATEPSNQIETGLDHALEKTLLDDEFEFIAMEQSVTIASKLEEAISKAPSIVTVITAKEIENLGARTLTDILRMVPGFDIIKESQFGRTDISVRGVSTDQVEAEKVKVLIDGHLINRPWSGGAFLFFDDLPLKNVKRIEIIRGPGSALYGANAFLAVINVITKSASDIDGIEASSGFGSFDTQEYSILYGEKLRGIDVAGFIDFYNTNGLSDTIKEDAISTQPFFNRFSITPGDTDDSRNKLDLNLKLAYKDVEFKAKYMNKDQEPFVGPQFVLTNDNDQFLNYVMSELSYKLDLWDKLTVKPRLYYDQYDSEFQGEVFPDDFTVPVDIDGDGDIERFPDGMLGIAKLTNRRLGSELQLDYDLFDHNTFTLGFNYEWENQDNVNFSANFDPLTGASLGSIKDVSDYANWSKEVVRQIWAVYIQDKWNITDKLGITMGIRHDHYSDFEGTTNPRVGIVWNFMENANLKLLYGQGFRAPSFNELFTINNPVFLGNPDLKPETIRTYEVGLDYKFTDELNANVNYFFNVIRDEISLGPKIAPEEPQVFENIDGSNIQGIEFEVKADLHKLRKGSYAFANYTYQDAESKGDPLPDVPKHKGNIGFNVEIIKYLNANLHAFISDDRARVEDDTRDDSPGYSILNLTLIAKEFFNEMQIKASLFNLLDKDYNDPTPINTIPTDLPRPGRTFFIGLEYGW